MESHHNLLKLYPVASPFGESTAYTIKPLIFEKFETGKFIPLLILDSFWWDADANIFRVCGESKLSPDMTSSILKESPHYYIMDVNFYKTIRE